MWKLHPFSGQKIALPVVPSAKVSRLLSSFDFNQQQLRMHASFFMALNTSFFIHIVKTGLKLFKMAVHLTTTTITSPFLVASDHVRRQLCYLVKLHNQVSFVGSTSFKHEAGYIDDRQHLIYAFRRQLIDKIFYSKPKSSDVYSLALCRIAHFPTSWLSSVWFKCPSRHVQSCCNKQGVVKYNLDV